MVVGVFVGDHPCFYTIARATIARTHVDPTRRCATRYFAAETEAEHRAWLFALGMKTDTSVRAQSVEDRTDEATVLKEWINGVTAGASGDGGGGGVPRVEFLDRDLKDGIVLSAVVDALLVRVLLCSREGGMGYRAWVRGRACGCVQSTFATPPPFLFFWPITLLLYRSARSRWQGPGELDVPDLASKKQFVDILEAVRSRLAAADIPVDRWQVRCLRCLPRRVRARVCDCVAPRIPRCAQPCMFVWLRRWLVAYLSAQIYSHLPTHPSPGKPHRSAIL